MKVLSLFDGMSCGQIALRELGMPIERYYASEIDKHAIAQTQLNFPDTIHLGDVEKWREWDIEWEEIDLLLAGSPCQGFSLAGKMLGHDDPRSRLYWVFLDIMHHVQRVNPNVKFLLENVRMRPADEARINESLGIRPVVINSALVSAQNRVRLYWSNIQTKSEGLWGELLTDIPQPADRGIYIGDILDDEVDEKYYMRNLPLNEEAIESIATTQEGASDVVKLDKKLKPKAQQDKASCLTAGGHSGGNHSDMDILYIRDPWLRKNLRTPSDKANALLSCSYKGARANGMSVVPGTWRTHKDGQGFRSTAGGKAPCIPARARNDGSGQPVAKIGCMLRRLTPTECARLQTIPDWYKWGCSDTQAYKMLGNGWTVEVVKHILSHIIK
nr:MAG TPA: Cytosine specific methyltransferase [Caudoviricetes sp.]